MNTTIDDLDTGDIILFCGGSESWLSWLTSIIKYSTHSNYTHIGFIIKDPNFLAKPLEGTYVWESGWEAKPDPQDNKIKLGVQITDINQMLEEYKGEKIIIRKFIGDRNKFFSYKNLQEVHQIVYNKPYDTHIIDWLLAFFRKDLKKQNTDRFWCSAFVGFIYTKCGVLKDDTDWSVLYPSDFSLDGENLNFVNGCSLENCETRIF